MDAPLSLEDFNTGNRQIHFLMKIYVFFHIKSVLFSNVGDWHAFDGCKAQWFMYFFEQVFYWPGCFVSASFPCAIWNHDFNNLENI